MNVISDGYYSYREYGDAGLVSGHRRKPSNHRLKKTIRQTIIAFIEDPVFENFGPTLLNEKLRRIPGIMISKETLRQIMIEEGKHHPKIKQKSAHPQRERRFSERRTGPNRWLLSCLAGKPGTQSCLILFVDDATSAVSGWGICGP